MLKYVIGAVDAINSLYVYFSFEKDLIVPHCRKCEATEFDKEEVENAINLVQQKGFQYMNVKAHLLL